MIMRGFQHLYPGSLKISYIILILIIFGIGFYFVSLPELKNEAITTTTEATATTSPNTFIPSAEAEHEPVMFTSRTPMWKFYVEEDQWIGSPEDGNIIVSAGNRFLVDSGEWVFLYIMETENIENIERNVNAGDPILKSSSNTFLFGVAKNCDTTMDVFLNCNFLDPIEYFE